MSYMTEGLPPPLDEAALNAGRDDADRDPRVRRWRPRARGLREARRGVST